MAEIAHAVLLQFLLFTALLTPLELLFPARAGQLPLRRESHVDLLYFALAPFFIAIGSGILLAVLGAAVTALRPDAVTHALASQPWSVQLVEVVLGSELLAWLAHFASHRVPFLWRFHAVHHSATELDWLATHRQHPIESVWLLGLAGFPAIVLGFSTAPLVGFILFQKTYSAFLHANVRLELPGATWLIATPRFHRWHHDAGDRRGRNFSSLLPIFDRLFGTYALPPGEPAQLGCDAKVPRSWLAQLAFPFFAR
jgi:sterol desaturase/sphingolipid hydroxylase (fatty acid hydroxylase superfamily)